MRLRLARIGGGTLIAACVAFLVAAAMVIGGQAVGAGVQGVGGLTFSLAVALAVPATVLLAAFATGPVGRPWTRVGFAILAIGLLAFAGSIVAIELGADLLTAIILQIAIGGTAMLLGWFVIGVSLARRVDAGRPFGRLLLAGLGLVPVWAVLSNLRDTGLELAALGAPVAGLGVALILAAMAGIGYLALRQQWSWRPPG